MAHFTDPFAAWRADFWWRWKIPPLLAAAYGQVLVLGIPPGPALFLVFSALLVVSGAAAFGYAVNDLADRKSDEAAGKPNAMRLLTARQRAFAVALPLLAALSAAALADFGRPAVLVLLLEFALAAAYSLPPARLKARGFAGVLAEAAAVLALPCLVIVLAFSHRAAAAPLRALIFDAFILAHCLASGIKGILSHQDLDRENDRAAGLATFGALIEHARIRRILAFWCYPAELAALCGAAAAVYPAAPLVLPVFVLYASMELSKMGMGWRVTIGAGQIRYLPFFNNFFQELTWPLTLAFSLAVAHPILAVLPLFQVLLFFGNIPQQMEEFLRLNESWKKRHADLHVSRKRREIEAIQHSDRYTRGRK